MRKTYESRTVSRQASHACAAFVCCSSRNSSMFTAMAMAEILCALGLIIIGIIIW